MDILTIDYGIYQNNEPCDPLQRFGNIRVAWYQLTASYKIPLVFIILIKIVVITVSHFILKTNLIVQYISQEFLEIVSDALIVNWK